MFISNQLVGRWLTEGLNGIWGEQLYPVDKSYYVLIKTVIKWKITLNSRRVFGGTGRNFRAIKRHSATPISNELYTVFQCASSRRASFGQ